LAGAGTYAAEVTLDALLEEGGASAQPLAGSEVTLQGAARRYAVLGATDEGGPDFYSIDLTAGEAADVVLTPLAGAALELELQDAAGTVLAPGGPLTADPPGLVVRNFVAPATGTYHLRVSGPAGGTYSLVVARQANLALDGRYFTDFEAG